MAAYVFDTITAAQALAFSSSDTLSFQAGTAVQASVTYLGNGDISVAVGGLSVEFAAALATVSQSGMFHFDDGSSLYVGDGSNNAASTTGDIHADALFGGAGDDTLILGAGGLIQGNQGNDALSAGGGQATMYGGQGNDTFSAMSGEHDSFMQGNKGDDLLQGGSFDTLLGGQGDDTISGGGILDGNLGNDSLTGTGQLLGEGGNDTLTSNGFGDVLTAGDGDDSLTSSVSAAGGTVMDGGAGDDSITTNHAHDTLLGGAGDDVLTSTGSSNSMTGGAGADRFLFGTVPTSPGSVTAITDWNGAEDKLSFTGFTPGTSDFTSTTATDYADALAAANNQLSAHHFTFVGVQVGADFIIFAGGAGGATSAVDLVGRTLADFREATNLF